MEYSFGKKYCNLNYYELAKFCKICLLLFIIYVLKLSWRNISIILYVFLSNLKSNLDGAYIDDFREINDLNYSFNSWGGWSWFCPLIIRQSTMTFLLMLKLLDWSRHDIRELLRWRKKNLFLWFFLKFLIKQLSLYHLISKVSD